jgi:hypothetical protein
MCAGWRGVFGEVGELIITPPVRLPLFICPLVRLPRLYAPLIIDHSPLFMFSWIITGLTKDAQSSCASVYGYASSSPECRPVAAGPAPPSHPHTLVMPPARELHILPVHLLQAAPTQAPADRTERARSTAPPPQPLLPPSPWLICQPNPVSWRAARLASRPFF